MMVSEGILKEASILLSSLAMGVILAFVYDLLRIIRRIIPHGKWWIAAEDFLFWAGSAVAVFMMLCRENDGLLRGFAIGGVVVGMALYTMLISRFVIKGSVFVLEKVLYVVFRPMVWLVRLLKRPCRAVGSGGKKVLRNLKKRLKKIVKAVKMSLCKL